MADTDTGPELPPVMTPGAQAALLGGGPAAALSGEDEDAKLRRELFREQIQQEKDLTKREQETYTKREAELEPMRRDIAAGMKEQTRIGNLATERYLRSQQDIPPAPSFNGQQAQQDALAWMSLAAGFGAIAGGLSRYHTTTALNAFSGMMTGFAKGQLEVFETNYKTWQANADRSIEYNARAQREYRAIMGNAKMNIDQKANLMEMTANKWQDQLMADSARGRHLERMTQLMEAQARYEEGLKFRRDQMTQHHDDKMAQIDAGLAAKGFKRDENNKIIPDPDNPAVMDDQAINTMVERRLLGDKGVLQNIGRGTQGAANIAKFNNRLAEVMARRGITAQELVTLDQQYAGGQSYQVAAGRYASRVESATYEMFQAIPLAEKASARFERGDWVPWNTLLNQYKAQKSDPAYNDFIVKAMTARNAYVRAMNPTGNPRIAERLELQADKILDAAIGPQAFSTQLRGMWQEAENSRIAIAETRGLPPPEPRPYPGDVATGAGGTGGAGGSVTEFHYDSQGNRIQ